MDKIVNIMLENGENVCAYLLDSVVLNDTEYFMVSNSDSNAEESNVMFLKRIEENLLIVNDQSEMEVLVGYFIGKTDDVEFYLG